MNKGMEAPSSTERLRAAEMASSGQRDREVRLEESARAASELPCRPLGSSAVALASPCGVQAG